MSLLTLPLCSRHVWPGSPLFRCERDQACLLDPGASADPDFPPSWNVAPTDPLPVVRYDQRTNERSLDLMRWGLVPFWAKDIKVVFANINAGRQPASGTQGAGEDRRTDLRIYLARQRKPISRLATSRTWSSLMGVTQLRLKLLPLWVMRDRRFNILSPRGENVRFVRAVFS